jgi:putative ATPase
VPLHIRNAPTRLMKESGYGKGYQYAHDYEEGYSGQPCLPDSLTGRKFYEPKGHGYEKNIVERMAWLRTKSKSHQDPDT